MLVTIVTLVTKMLLLDDLDQFSALDVNPSFNSMKEGLRGYLLHRHVFLNDVVLLSP